MSAADRAHPDEPAHRRNWLAEVRASGLPVPDSVKAIAGRIAGRLVTLRRCPLAVADLLDKGQNPIPMPRMYDLGTEFEQTVPG
ncbi:hypothetical protein ACTMU2_32220 [Cupriavidus basilensis]